MLTILVRESYDIVTPESAEDGDAAERGWIDEDGTEYTFRELVELLEGTEPSSGQFHEGLWYSRTLDQNPRDASYETRAYHLVNASLRVQRRLYSVLNS